MNSLLNQMGTGRDWQDYLGMLRDHEKNVRLQSTPELFTGMPNEDITQPIWELSPNPNRVDPNYIGGGSYHNLNASLKGTMPKRPGMTNEEVDWANFMGLEVTPRNVPQSFYDPQARRASLYPGGRDARSIPLAVPGPGGPSVYERDPQALRERAMHTTAAPFDPSTDLRERAMHNAAVAAPHYPWTWAGPYSPTITPASIDLRNRSENQPERGTDALEGPELGFSKAAMAKAAEMIAASQQGAPTAKPFVTRMGNRKSVPYQVTSSSGRYASPYLRRRKEEGVA